MVLANTTMQAWCEQCWAAIAVSDLACAQFIHAKTCFIPCDLYTSHVSVALPQGVHRADGVLDLFQRLNHHELCRFRGSNWKKPDRTYSSIFVGYRKLPEI